jgi:hypothetical protein
MHGGNLFDVESEFTNPVGELNCDFVAGSDECAAE